ncbi:40S ribosomal protein S6 [Paramarasmius palmivorus]|uniref:40S ribosomal protein S6 n=1 Tax=Paramarasmius palmivorus TaxID=297713 RepID=A0AAW0EDY4_9AGAR
MNASPTKTIGVSSTAVSEAPTLLVLALLLCRYLRRLYYPCITIDEMNKAETSLDNAFNDAVRDNYMLEFEQDIIDQKGRGVKNKASEIRTRSLESLTSIWKKCFNVEVELFPDIVAWNTEAQALEKEISTIVELEKRYRYNIELGRRAMVATNV